MKNVCEYEKYPSSNKILKAILKFYTDANYNNDDDLAMTIPRLISSKNRRAKMIGSARVQNINIFH